MKDRIFFLCLSLCILFLNIAPLFIDIYHAPPGRTFALIHNNAQDFFFYLSLMRQGAEGNWLTHDPYTSETHHSSPIFSYFLWIGKISSFLHIPLPWMYHGLRFLFGFFSLYLAFRLIRILSSSPRLTFFFFVFSAGFFHGYNGGSSVITVPFMHWWTGIDPIRRSAYLPHHMIGAALLISTVYFFTQYTYTKKKTWMYYAFLCIPCMAFIHTPSLFILLLVLPPTFLFQCFFYHVPFSRSSFISNLKFQISNYILFFCYWICGVFSLGLMVSQTNRGFPWTQYIEWEKNLQFPLMTEFPGALGILLPFALLGIVAMIRKKNFISYFTISWLVIPYLFIPIAPRIGMSNIRLIQGVPYLPLAILATHGVHSIELFIRILAKQYGYRITNLHQGWTLLVIVVFTACVAPVYWWSMNDQIREYRPIYGNIYFDDRLFDAFSYINRTYPAGIITLSTFYTGNYLPAFTNVTSVIGHYGYTQQVNQKEEQAGKFFSGTMTEKEATSFLDTEHVSLVFQGPEETPIFSGDLYPTILKKVYSHDPVTLYERIHTPSP